MAQTRVHKIGTIYSRMTGLLVSGALNPLEMPLWYELYKAFPPKYEPRFDRQDPHVPIRNIFYKEDIYRAKFHKEYPEYANGNLLPSDNFTATEKFVAICRHLEKRVPEDEIYNTALKVLPRYVQAFSVRQAQQQNEDMKTEKCDTS